VKEREDELDRERERVFVCMTDPGVELDVRVSAVALDAGDSDFGEWLVGTMDDRVVVVVVEGVRVRVGGGREFMSGSAWFSDGAAWFSDGAAWFSDGVVLVLSGGGWVGTGRPYDGGLGCGCADCMWLD
jgi:hypothetical protein